MIFWENELGSSTLGRHAFPSGTYIFNIARIYIDNYQASYPYPTVENFTEIPSIAIPLRPMQQSVTKLPPNPNMPSTSTPLTWLPPVTTSDIPDFEYTDVRFMYESSPTLQSAVMFVALDPQCLGFSLAHGRISRSYHEAMYRKYGPQWLKAMHTQLRKLSNTHTWSLVPLPSGKTAI